jgi:hypothetical protein
MLSPSLSHRRPVIESTPSEAVDGIGPVRETQCQTTFAATRLPPKSVRIMRSNDAPLALISLIASRLKEIYCQGRISAAISDLLCAASAGREIRIKSTCNRSFDTCGLSVSVIFRQKVRVQSIVVVVQRREAQ